MRDLDWGLGVLGESCEGLGGDWEIYGSSWAVFTMGLGGILGGLNDLECLPLRVARRGFRVRVGGSNFANENPLRAVS